MTFKLSRLRAYAALWLVFAVAIAATVLSTAHAEPAGTNRGTKGPETPAAYTLARARALDRAVTARLQAGTVKPKASAVNYGSGLWSGLVGAEYRSGDPATSSVTLAGDSIAVRCTPDIRAALAAQGQSLAVIAWSGARTADVLGMLQGEQLSPKIVLVAGTNDVFDPPAAAGSVRDTVAWLAQTGTKAYWVTAYVGRTATWTDDTRNAGQVNAYIAGAVSAQWGQAGASRVIDWVGALTAARGRGRTTGYYVQDGKHPWADAGTSGGVAHGDGCAAYAVGIAAAVKGA